MRDPSYRKNLSNRVREYNLNLQSLSQQFVPQSLPKWTLEEETLLLEMFPAAAQSRSWEPLFSRFQRSYFSLRTKYHQLQRRAQGTIRLRNRISQERVAQKRRRADLQTLSLNSLSRNRKTWTPTEELFLLIMYPRLKRNWQTLFDAFGRSYQTLSQRYFALRSKARAA